MLLSILRRLSNLLFCLLFANSVYASDVNLTGNNNNIYIEQASISDFTVTVVGDTNSLSLTQLGKVAKTSQINIQGNTNTATVVQTDNGNHFLALDIVGDGHTASVLQQGDGNHSATVVLDGSQPWNFDLTQSGITNQTYNLVNGTCNAVGGCNLSVTQQ